MPRSELTHERAWWVFPAVLYALLMTVTVARYMGDTSDYAESIEAVLRGGDYEFVEFGHLLWRPLGFVTYRLTRPLLDRAVGPDPHAGIITVLMAWNYVAGLVSVLGLNRLVRRVGVRGWAAGLSTWAFCVAFGFLDFAHSGSSYIPGLTCLVLAMAVLAGAVTESAWAAIAAGVGLACSVGFWAPFVLVVPMSLAFPLVWFGVDRRRWRFVALMTTIFVLVLGSVYTVAITEVGIRDLRGLGAWVTTSSHGIVKVRGVSRAVFGLPRSFLDVGNEGVVFKRYLLRDLYHPVILAELVRLSLAKIALFYVVLIATLVSLLRRAAGQRMLVLLALGGGPVLAFALAWQGGDIERYLPVYPLIFAAWALVLSSPAWSRRQAPRVEAESRGQRAETKGPSEVLVADRSALVHWPRLGTLKGDSASRGVQGLVLGLVVVMSVTNLTALSETARDHRRAKLAERTEGLLPVLGPNDRVWVVSLRDDLAQSANDPFFPIARAVNVMVLVPLGYATTAQWHESFARKVREIWTQGGSVWVTKRAFQPRPRSAWGWVEGEDRSVSWPDLPAYFARFAMGRTVGGENGFVLLPHTPDNERLLQPEPRPGRAVGPRR